MSSFPSMKPLLLLLVVFSSYCSETLQASREHQHYHTTELRSLLPASTCSNSVTKRTKSSSSSSSQSTTLEVTHKHGLCSKLTQGKPMVEPSLDEILTQDQARVKRIQARVKPDPAKTKPPKPNSSKQTDNLIDQEDANLPARSGSSLNSGNYIVSVGLGTPKTTLSLIFDTGSDLTWTQCQPCAGSCYQQQDPIFDPTKSSTYSNVSCSSNQCKQLSSTTGVNPRCARPDTCVYGIQYGDRSFSVGFLGRDTLALTSSDSFPSFYFGCGQNNQGLFGKTAGLIGLGRDPLSIVSQTAPKYGKYFSYCLPSTSSSTGFLTFGKGGGSSNNLQFTPFSGSQGNQYYFIDIESIYVGGQQLSISQSVFSSAGSIIDSGTVITRLPPAAYDAMSSAFKQLMLQKYQSAPAFSILDTCFDFGTETTISIPSIAFVFNGNLKVDLDSSGILILVNTTQACLAFAGNSGSTDLGIFGNTQQKTFEVAYDVDGGKLGFGAGGCN